METFDKEKLITAYFHMWERRDFTFLDDLFDANIYYSECYGPEYLGLDEIRLWVNDMLQKQKVLEWKIKRFIHAESTVVVEWYFKEEYNNIQRGFDGLSIIEFTKNEKILSIKEFKSKAEHTTPYRFCVSK